jgi:excisionase family DNA binding protein
MKNRLSTTENESRKIHSLKELAILLGCSIATAQKVKNSGRIPYYQMGRKVIFDSNDVLKALERGLKN